MSETKKEELFPTNTSRWNSVIEKNIKEMGEACKGYKWMHVHSSQINSKYYARIMYAVIIFPPIGAVFGTIYNLYSTNILLIFQIVCGFLGGIFGTMMKYGKFYQKSEEHKNAAAKYASLEGNIKRQLSLYRDDRVNAGKYLQWVSISYDDLFSSSPFVNHDIYEKWAIKAKNEKLYIPKEYGPTVEMENTDVENNMSSIKVNNQQSSADLYKIAEEPEEKPKNEVKIDINKKVYKRQQTSLPELHKFEDQRMAYEMGRMFGFESAENIE